jgi:hypothetical protein
VTEHAQTAAARKLGVKQCSVSSAEQGVAVLLMLRINARTHAGIQSPFVFWGLLTDGLLRLALTCAVAPAPAKPQRCAPDNRFSAAGKRSSSNTVPRTNAQSGVKIGSLRKYWTVIRLAGCAFVTRV